MNSKAVAILIICLGVIALVASAALGSIFDQNEALAAWSAEAQVAAAPSMPAKPAVTRRHAPAPGRAPAFDDSRDIACEVAMERVAERAAGRIYCTLADGVPATWRCPGKSARNCVGDLPPEEAEVQQVRN